MNRYLSLFLFIGLAWGQTGDAWVVSDGIDPIDDSKTITLLTKSQSGENHYGEKIDLIVRCNSSKVDLYLNWDVFLGTDISVTTRIDKEKAVTEEWSISSNKKASFSYTPISLIKKLINADKYVAKVTPY